MSSSSGLPHHIPPAAYPPPVLKLSIPRTKEKRFDKIVLSPPGAPRHEDKVDKVAGEALKKTSP